MRYIGTTCGLVLAAVAVLVVRQPASIAQPPAPIPVGPLTNAHGNIPGEDVLTRGPLHEAFAAPVNLSGVVPPIVAKRPPEPINEAPSAYRPEGETVWIPGYWDWDDQNGNFVWVSGIWRTPPPDRQWIGGYWTQTVDGFQRAPGFWTGADTEEVQYFPQPPAPAEQGPTTEPPSADAFWVPGCWVWQGNQFTWTSGFWTAGRPGWVWTPTSYSWTPRGYVLVNGYWDYDLDHRGVAFAPVALSPAVYQQPGFVFTPSVVIDPGILSFYLFARRPFASTTSATTSARNTIDLVSIRGMPSIAPQVTATIRCLPTIAGTMPGAIRIGSTTSSTGTTTTASIPTPGRLTHLPKRKNLRPHEPTAPIAASFPSGSRSPASRGTRHFPFGLLL